MLETGRDDSKSSLNTMDKCRRNQFHAPSRWELVTVCRLVNSLDGIQFSFTELCKATCHIGYCRSFFDMFVFYNASVQGLGSYLIVSAV